MRKPLPDPGRLRATILCLVWLFGLGCGGSDESQDPLAEIREMQKAGRYEESLAPLDALLAAAPENAEAQLRMGKALLAVGRPGRAVWPLQRASEAPPTAVEAGTLLAQVLLESQNLEPAVEAADRVLGIAPDSEAALRIRARAHQRAGDGAAALADLDRLLQRAPKDLGLRWARALALRAVERPSDAVRVLEELGEVAAEEGNSAAAARACLGGAAILGEREGEESAGQQAALACLQRFPGDLAARQLVAGLLVERGDAEGALALWRDAVAADPESLPARAGLARQLEALERSDEARVLLEETAAASDSPLAWQLLSALLRRSGDAAGAQRALEQALAGEEAPSDLQQLTRVELLVEMGDLDRASRLANALQDPVARDYLRGRILAARGDYAEALEALDAALPAWPDHPTARLLAAQAAHQVGDLSRALEEYKAAYRSGRGEAGAALAAARIHLAVGDYAAAEQFARMQLQSGGRAGEESFLVLAQAVAAQGRFDAARQVLDALAEQDGDPIALWIGRAEVERRASGPAEAAQLLREAGLDLAAPDNALVLRALVMHEMEAGQAERALPLLTTAQERSPQTPELHDLRGRIQANSGQAYQARAEFERALELDPNYAPARVGIATLSARGEDFAAALAQLTQLGPEARFDVESRYAAAQIYRAAGQGEPARLQLEAVIREQPGHASACNDLAWDLASREQELDRALDLARRAQRLAPDPNHLDTLGYVQLQRGELERARRAFDAALAAEPIPLGTRYRLGLVLEALGDRDGARAQYRLAAAERGASEAPLARAALTELDPP
jgi:tetratricopeptide (TPR) repeat protein